MTKRTKHENKVVPGCGFHHIAIRTYHWDASMKFWVDAMGFSPAANWGEAPARAVMLDTGDGNYLEVFERESAATMEATTGEPPILHLCFRTDDCDAAVERARAAGAQVTIEPKTLEPFPNQDFPVRLAFIKGPDGEICEFFQNEVL